MASSPVPDPEVSQDPFVQEKGIFSGPKGDKGHQGEHGRRGKRGYRGKRGKHGAKGDAGPEGPAGATGADGPPGLDGATGSKGDTGDPGPEGPQGPTGASGGDTSVLDSLSPVYFEDFVSGSTESGHIGAFGWQYDGNSSFLSYYPDQEDNHPGVLRMASSAIGAPPLLKLNPSDPDISATTLGRDFDLVVVFRVNGNDGEEEDPQGSAQLGWDNFQSALVARGRIYLGVNMNNNKEDGWPVQGFSSKGTSSATTDEILRIRADKWYKLRMTKVGTGSVVFTITPEDPSEGGPYTKEITDASKIPSTPLNLFATIGTYGASYIDLDCVCWKFLNVQR